MSRIKQAIGYVLVTAMLVLALTGSAPGSQAASPPGEVKIGSLHPLTGNIASDGQDCKAAMELAVDIINGEYDLDIPFARTKGLPNLGGAKIVLVPADYQGDPETAAIETERLITREKVAAIIGSNQSSASAKIGQVCERLRVPYLCDSTSSPRLTEMGFKWFFRTTPHDETFSQLMFDFLDDLRKRGEKIETVVIVHEDSTFGEDSGDVQVRLAKERGYKVLDRVRYSHKTSSLDGEVLRMKAMNPDVVLPASYAPDAILMLEAFARHKFQPRIVIAQDSGHEDPAWVTAVGKRGDGVMTRSVFSLDLADAKPSIGPINELFKQRHGKPLDGSTSRAFQGLMVLADAINRSGSTDREQIRQALVATDIPGERLIMPWRGVKFDAKGQNVKADAILLQLQDGEYRLVYPFELTPESVKLIYPMRPWN